MLIDKAPYEAVLTNPISSGRREKKKKQKKKIFDDTSFSETWNNCDYRSILFICLSLEIKFGKKIIQIFLIEAWLHGLISYWRISVSLKHDPARQTEAEECPAFPQTLRRQRRTQTDRESRA